MKKALTDSRQEVQDLQDEIKSLKRRLEPKVLDARFDAGEIDMTIEVARDVMTGMAEAMVVMLDDVSAPNFIEVVCKPAHGNDEYIMTIQRPNRPTPVQIIKQLRESMFESYVNAGVVEERVRLFNTIQELGYQEAYMEWAKEQSEYAE